MKDVSFYFKVILLIFIGCFFVPTISSAATLRLPPNNSGLVGYWSFDEIGGSLAHDQSGNGKSATLFNSPGWVNGKHRNALQFSNGSTQYLLMNTALPAVSSNGSQTFSTWINTTASISPIFSMRNSGDGNPIFDLTVGYDGLTLANGKLQLIVRYDSGNGLTEVASTGTINDGRWHFVTGILDQANDNISIYIDGVFNNSASLSGVKGSITTTANLQSIGAEKYWIDNNSFSPTDRYFIGLIDEPRIYNRALSATEIAKLYQSGSVSVKAPTNTGLVGYWSFDEGSGTVTHDQSGNGITGSLQSSPTWILGKHGTALQFNGTTQYVSNPTLNWAGGPVTISFWNYVATSDVQQASAFGAGNADLASNRFQAHVPWSDHALYWDYGDINGNGRISTNYTNYENKWTYVTLVSAGSGGGFKAIYLDGVQVTSSGSSDNPTNLTGFNIGKVDSGTPFYHKGKIDDFRIYNRVLSATEIQSLYKSGAIVNNASTNTKLTNSLVGLWSFNGPDLNGTTAYDRSGQGNNGTLTNSPAVTFGKIGQALSFNGTNQGVNIGAVSTTATNNLTFAAWMYSVSNSDTGVIYYNGKSDADGYGFVMNLNSSCSNTTDHHIAILLGGVTCDVLGSSYVLPTNQWVHVVGVRDSGTWKLYANGVLQTTGGTTAPNTPFTRSGIGSNGNASNFFPGKIDEVRVYNRALSASEISQLYNMGK